jgi:type 1 glutamine amidotransferase
LGGWGGRNEASGPYVRFRDGQIVRDTTAGSGGHHGKQHPFQVVIRNAEHPITAGMPPAWMHASDELYDKLRGPAENITLLATAYADPAQGGSGEHEPMMLTVAYGDGRVFHTPMGHSPAAMKCVGFLVTLQRGAEWAATGKVTQTKLPANFPTADAVSTQE